MLDLAQPEETVAPAGLEVQVEVEGLAPTTVAMAATVPVVGSVVLVEQAEQVPTDRPCSFLSREVWLTCKLQAGPIRKIIQPCQV